MRKRALQTVVACLSTVALAVSMVPISATPAQAEGSNERYWSAPTEAVTVDYNSILKTYGVRAGSAGPDFVGVSNTNFDFSAASPSAYTSSQYKGYTAQDLVGVKGAGLAIWATSVNENPNPFYVNLFYNAFYDASKTSAAATTWVANPETSSWGDSYGNRSQKADGSYSINGLEYSPEIIFGANKSTNWGNADYSSTNIYQATAGDASYNPTFVNNDATNMWSQVYTLNQLAATADSLKTTTNKTTRYDSNSAMTGALSFEKSIRGNLLYVASQIDQGNAKKKTVAYLYAIKDGTGYFFIPQADGLVSGNDTGGVTSSESRVADSCYAANNGTIDLTYMGSLPFVTNTFTEGTPVSGGIVMMVEDIYKSNPAVSVDSSQKSALADVDVIIYNSTTKTDLQGVKNGMNSSGINNSVALSTDIVTSWAKEHGFKGTQVIAGDDFGTSTQQGYGNRTATSDGMAPLLYCQRNYTADKLARVAWAYAKVYPELYPNDDATYAYWVDKVYHIKTENVATVVAYMTNQSDEVVYTEDTAKELESCFQAGLDWWNAKGSKDATWSKYAYYSGSSRASFYDKNTASEEPGKTIGIFAPTSSWQNTSTSAIDKSALTSAISSAQTDLSGTPVSASGEDVAEGTQWVKQETADALSEAISAAQKVADAYVSQSQIDAAVSTLNAALKTFDNRKQTGAAASVAWKRLYGDVRYDTMAAISQQGFSKSDTVFIASGENFPDALAATALAGFYNAPVLLTSKDSLSAQAALEIKRLGADYAVLVGGEAAISAGVRTEIEELGLNTNRLYGDTRIETALEVYKQGVTFSAWGKTAIVATGEGYADALSIASYAYANDAPIFLTNADKVLTDDAVSAIKQGGFSRVLFIGGNAVVSDEVASQIGNSVEYVRLGGKTRYETSAVVAQFCLGEGMQVEGMAVAYGENFPDALAGGALCGASKSILMLANEDNPGYVTSLLKSNQDKVTYAYALGGTSVISDDLLNKFKQAF